MTSAGIAAPASASVAWTVELADVAGTVAWSPAGHSIAAGSMSGEVIVAGAESGGIRGTPAAHALGVLDIAWSPDGSRLASAGHDGRVVISDTGHATVIAEVAGRGEARCVGWSRDGRHLAAGIGPELVVLGSNGHGALRVPEQPSTVTDVAWSADGRRVGVACYGGVRWYEPGRSAGRPARVFAWKGSLLCLHVSPDGRHAASGNQDCSVHVWRLWSGRDMEMTGYPVKIDQISWHPQSRLLAVGGPGDVTVWDFGGSGPEGSTPRTVVAHEGRLSGLAYSPDGSTLATAAGDGWLKVWGTDGDTPLAAWRAGSGVTCLAWSPASNAIVAGTQRGTVHRVDLQ